MKSNAPWSVKGIERDARETAKEAAKREGMTVGEWLNQMIYAAGDPEETTGEIEGLRMRDMVTAIEHLHKRINDSTKSGEAHLTEATQKIGDIVERVQRLERGKSVGGSEALATRVEKLETGGGRDRVEALKALEKAVAQVAVQFSTSQKATMDRLDSTEEQVRNLVSHLDSGDAPVSGGADMSFLKSTIKDIQTRLDRNEQLLSDTPNAESSGDPAFIESTSNRLRVLGEEIKRGGDQISAIERSISKLGEQIQAAEQRSAEGVQKTAETLSALREKLSQPDAEGAAGDVLQAALFDARITAERVDQLQSTFESMITRLSAIETGALPSNQTKSFTPPAKVTVDDPVASAPLTLDAGQAPATASSGDGKSDELGVAEIDAPSMATISADDAEIFDTPRKNSNSAMFEDTDEDDDDFFSFADDIDATIDESPTGEQDAEDFSFELDDKPSDAANATSPADELLSEVQAAFDDAGANNEPETKPAASSVDQDLDELLAGLEGEPTTPPADAKDPVNSSDASPSEDSLFAEDLIKDDAEQEKPQSETAKALEAPKDKSVKRKLTPKQKAILAARLRKRRQDTQSTQAAALADVSAKAASAPSSADITAFDEDGLTKAENITAPQKRKPGLFSKLPIIGGKGDETRNEAVDDMDGDAVAIDTLRDTASTKPVTLALGVGIFLAVGLLFYMMKDLIFAPKQDTASAPATDSIASETVTLNEETPTPTIEPKTLFQDAMTGLNAAGSNAEMTLAIEKLERAALLGHPPAQLQLGELYKTGQGVEQELTQARTWFRRAANGGNVLAMHRIGVMTARGEGGAANTEEAVGWFEQAADRGLIDSQYNLGAIFHPSGQTSNGIQDAGKAYFWYSLATLNGDEQARPLAAGVGASLSSSERAEIDAAVGAWEALPADEDANALPSAG